MTSSLQWIFNILRFIFLPLNLLGNTDYLSNMNLFFIIWLFGDRESLKILDLFLRVNLFRFVIVFIGWIFSKKRFLRLSESLIISDYSYYLNRSIDINTYYFNLLYTLIIYCLRIFFHFMITYPIWIFYQIWLLDTEESFQKSDFFVFVNLF